MQLTATPNSGFAFTGWSGNATGTQNPLVITMDANKTITANFVGTFTLSVAVSGSGSVGVSGQKSVYLPGEVVTLTATADSGSGFANWSGASGATTTTLQLTMDGNKTVTANFKRVRLLTSAATGQGTVTRTPDGADRSADGSSASYLDGSVVQVTATAANGWQFVEWTGALSGSTTPTSLTLDADRQVGATFKQLFTVTTGVNPASSGSVALTPSGGTYLDGTVVQVTASPATLKKFDGWSGI